MGHLKKYTPIGFDNFTGFVDSGFLTINCFGNGILNRLLARLCFEERITPKDASERVQPQNGI